MRPGKGPEVKEEDTVTAHSAKNNGGDGDGDRLRDAVLLVSEAGVPGLRLPLLMARFHRLAVKAAISGRVTVTDDELQMLRSLTAAGAQAAASIGEGAVGAQEGSTGSTAGEADNDEGTWGCYSSAAANGGLWAVWEQQVLRSAALLPGNSGNSGTATKHSSKEPQHECARYRLSLSGGDAGGMNRDVPNPRHLLGWGRLASALVYRGWGALEGTLASFEHVYGVSVGVGCARLLCATLRSRLQAALPIGALATASMSMAVVLQEDNGAGDAANFAEDESAALAVGGVNGLLQSPLAAVLTDCTSEAIGRELVLLHTLLQHRFVLEVQLRLVVGGTIAVLPRLTNSKWKIPPRQLLSLPALVMQLLQATSTTDGGASKADEATAGKKGAASLDVPAFPPLALQLGANLPLRPPTSADSASTSDQPAQASELVAGLQKVDELLPMIMTLLLERAKADSHRNTHKELDALHALLVRPCVTVPVDGEKKKAKKTKAQPKKCWLAPGTAAMARRCVLQFEGTAGRLREHAVAQTARLAWSSLSSAVQDVMHAMEHDSAQADSRTAGVAASVLEKVQLEWPEMVQRRGECPLVRFTPIVMREAEIDNEWRSR
jgi:hypothetical protein